MRSRRNPRSGFTLMEVLVAVGILDAQLQLQVTGPGGWPGGDGQHAGDRVDAQLQVVPLHSEVVEVGLVGIGVAIVLDDADVRAGRLGQAAELLLAVLELGDLLPELFELLDKLRLGLAVVLHELLAGAAI